MVIACEGVSILSSCQQTVHLLIIWAVHAYLATAATLYVVGSDLPKTADLNKMDKLLLGTLAVIFAAGAESILVSVLHEDGDLDVAEALEDVTVVALPVLYAILNAVLFGVPLLNTFCHDINCCEHLPRSVSTERTFIPWKRVQKVNPWLSATSHTQGEAGGARGGGEAGAARGSMATRNTASPPAELHGQNQNSNTSRSAKQVI